MKAGRSVVDFKSSVNESCDKAIKRDQYFFNSVTSGSLYSNALRHTVNNLFIFCFA